MQPRPTQRLSSAQECESFSENLLEHGQLCDGELVLFIYGNLWHGLWGLIDSISESNKQLYVWSAGVSAVIRGDHSDGKPTSSGKCSNDSRARGSRNHGQLRSPPRHRYQPFLHVGFSHFLERYSDPASQVDLRPQLLAGY